MAKVRLSKAQKAFREASDLVKDKSLELRTAERLHKMEVRKVNKVMRSLADVVRLSKAQEVELKAASDARSAAHERVVAARKEWLAAIDKMILAGEGIASKKKRKLH